MNVATFTPQRKDEVPPCYGKDWNGNAPECAGGPDPKFTDRDTGSHVREVCDYFQSCGSQVNARRLIPAAQLVRQAPPAPPTVQHSASTFREYAQQQQAAQVQAAAIAAAQRAAMAPQPPPQYVYPYQQQPAPQMMQMPAQYQHPAHTYQLNYQVPGYLTVPEQRSVEGSFWGLLGREALRSIGKAFGHTVANFFDANPFRLPPR